LIDLRKILQTIYRQIGQSTHLMTRGRTVRTNGKIAHGLKLESGYV